MDLTSPVQACPQCTDRRCDDHLCEAISTEGEGCTLGIALWWRRCPASSKVDHMFSEPVPQGLKGAWCRSVLQGLILRLCSSFPNPQGSAVLPAQGWEELMKIVESSMASGRKETAIAAIAIIASTVQVRDMLRHMHLHGSRSRLTLLSLHYQCFRCIRLLMPHSCSLLANSPRILSCCRVSIL